MVRTWLGGPATGPTAKANAYGLLRTIMGDAVEDGLMRANPVRVKRAGSKKRARELRVLTPGEFQTTRVPRAGTPYGERRSDVDGPHASDRMAIGFRARLPA